MEKCLPTDQQLVDRAASILARNRAFWPWQRIRACLFELAVAFAGRLPPYLIEAVFDFLDESGLAGFAREHVRKITLLLKTQEAFARIESENERTK